jgi:hypothetical protein
VRAVLDTNVVVSGLLTPHGTCARILDLRIDGAFTPGVDDRILAECEEILARPEPGIDPEDAGAVLVLVRTVAEPSRAGRGTGRSPIPPMRSSSRLPRPPVRRSSPGTSATSRSRRGAA